MPLPPRSLFFPKEIAGPLRDKEVVETQIYHDEAVVQRTDRGLAEGLGIHGKKKPTATLEIT